MIIDKGTVAAVVVTFNRKNLLIECLNGLLGQSYKLDAIYIIDNASSDGTDELLNEKGFIGEFDVIAGEYRKIIKSSHGETVVSYVRLSDNLGGAGGFYEGVKRAYEAGYDWLWLMDDDAEPDKYALEKLSKHFEREDAGALACVVRDTNNNIIVGHRGTVDFNDINIYRPIDIKEYDVNNIKKIDYASFVGFLVNSEAVKKVGYPNKDFFIHLDDLEYSIRIGQIASLYLVSDSYIVHKEATLKNTTPKKFLGIQSFRKPINSYWISYYGPRNSTYLGKKYSPNKVKFYGKLLKQYVKSLSAVMIFDDNKLKRMKLITDSYLDGLRGKLGRRYEPKSWNMKLNK